MDDIDQEKTAFACHQGLFQFNITPFGLTKAPAIFQELMARVLEGLDQFTVAYLDDILIFSATLEEHLAKSKTFLIDLGIIVHCMISYPKNSRTI